MGFPRDNSPRLYLERSSGSYVVVYPDCRNGNGTYTALANVLNGADPSLCSTGVSDAYIRNRLKRVEFGSLNETWKEEIRYYFDGTEGTNVPEAERGFWKVENFKDGKAVE